MIDDEPGDGRAARPAPQKHSGVSLHIERLVIEGVPLGSRQLVQLREAAQRELTRLIERDGVGSALKGGALPKLAGPTIQTGDPVRPAELGRQIARSVHESLIRGV